MSGTSLDGVDGVLVDLTSTPLRILASASRPFDAAFRQALLELNSPADNELHRAALAGNRIAWVYAQVVADLLRQSGVDKAEVHAIGAHGQTVRHQPPSANLDNARDQTQPPSSYTCQLINAALLAEHSGIDVVADLRSRDVAAGGQGAPLVPAFHRHVFAQANASVAVLNIGGIANLSVLPADANGALLGFDCGPGNVLLDAWCQQQIGQAFDAGGAWAAGGQCLPELLAQLLDNRYFSQRPPKSTGRDTFSLNWLADQVAPYADAAAQDIQATLTELTASACAESVRSYANDSKLLVVCGGGAFNTCLMQRLQAHLPAVQVVTSDAFGLHPLQVEAAAFAWLAQQTMARRPGNLPSVTGAAGPRILGAIYPA